MKQQSSRTYKGLVFNLRGKEVESLRFYDSVQVAIMAVPIV
jgi:hypothetical protein